MALDNFAIQCFLATVETKSITQAAKQVSRTQSAVSQQMAKLEEMLGKPLFVRGKHFTLTYEGEIFFEYAMKIDTLQREIIERFREPELVGEVHFGMPEDFASVYLSEVLADFTHLHPRIFLKVECDLTLNLFERFKQGEFDMVLVKMNRPEDFPNSLNVYSEKLEWVSHPNVIIDSQKPLPLVLSPRPCVYRSRAIKALEDAGIRSRLVFSSPSYAGTIAAVKAGLGITVLPRTMIPEQLKPMQHSYFPKLDDTHLSLLKRDASNAALASFEKFVVNKLHH